MFRFMVVLLFLGVAVVTAAAQDAALLQEFSETLLGLEDLERYTVTWEIVVNEWIASWADTELTSAIDRMVMINYTDHFFAGAEHFAFHRTANVTEERLHEDRIIEYSAEIRIAEGVIYARVDVLEGKMAGSYPADWTIWRYPDQWTALEDLLPHAYFAAVNSNSPLPLFDFSPDTVAALTAAPVNVHENTGTWYDSQARRLIIERWHEQNRHVLQTRPSFDTNDPYNLVLLDYPDPDSFTQVILHFEQERLIGVKDGRQFETTRFPRNAFEDGAADNLWVSVTYKRISAIDFRENNTNVAPAVE